MSIEAVSDFDMQTTPLYLDDSDQIRFDATVIDRDPEAIVLDRTAFYPTGGGQPNDTGTITVEGEQWAVQDVSGREQIRHHLDREPPAIDASVRGSVDESRRRAHMRYHTAQHLLSAVLLDMYDAETTGNQLYDDRARIDCAYERFHGADLEDIEDDVQSLIDDDLPVRWYELSRERAEAELDPSRTRLDLLPDAVDPVRIVEIEGVDRTACAGTHVSGTGDIGQFRITGRETAGRGHERIRFELQNATDLGGV